MSKKLSIQLKLAIPIMLILVLVLGLMNFIMARNNFESAKESANEKTLASAHAYALQIRLDIEHGLDIARNMAHMFDAYRKAGDTNREVVAEGLREVLEKNKFLIGSWTGWEPNAWDGKDSNYVGKKGHDQTGRFVPYLNWEGGKSSLTPLIAYDKPGDGDYYLVPKERMKETMVEPYLYPIDGVQVLMTSAVVPIANKEGKFIGVAGIDLPLKDMQKKAAEVKPFETSIAYLVSGGGNFASHPDEKLITKPAVFPFENEKIKEAISKGQELLITGTDAEDKAEYMIVVVPINIGFTEDPWALVVKTPTSTVFAAAKSQLWTQLIIALAGVLFLLAAVVLIARYIAKEVSHLSGRLQESGDLVSTAIHQLSIAGQSLSETSSQSAASLEETVASLEEMTSMVKMNSDNAKQAASLSAKSSEVAVHGEHEMQSLMDSMNEIASSSKKIEEIINVIDDIAFQTNLLALNASVEAARAGEHGKGFAVVAEAVRTLAQRSAVAAKDITGLIKESVEKIDLGTGKSAKSSEMLKEIVTSIKKVSDLNNEIAAASEEQSTGISQISKAMNQLDQSVQSNAASSEEIASTADEINRQAQLMKDVVHELNVVVYGEKASAFEEKQEAEIAKLHSNYKHSAHSKAA